MSRVGTGLKRLSTHTLFRGSLWMFLGQGVRVVVQAVYFVLIARALGPQGYGAFVCVTALASVLAPFASLGTGNLLIKQVSRDPSCFAAQWGRALAVTAVSGAALTLAAVSLSYLLLPQAVPFWLVLAVCLADLICYRLVDVAAQAFQGVNRLSETSQMMLMPNVVRLALLGVLLGLDRHPSVVAWGGVYLLGTAVSALAAVLFVNARIAGPAFDRSGMGRELAEGIYFSVSLSSQSVYNDIDKTLLSRLAGLGATGIYGAAYRIIDVSFVPIRSVLYASYRRYFQTGAKGIEGALTFTLKLLPYMACYGLLASAALFFCAPVVPLILGAQYAEVVPALRWLALLPLLKVLHYFAGDTLTGAGYQRARTLCQVAVALINVALLLWLIPLYSWRGAALASLAADLSLALATWYLVLRRVKSERGCRVGLAPAAQGR